MQQEYEYIPGAKHPIYGWTHGVPVDHKAREQLRNVADLPFIHKHVAIMPDVHVGRGATIGSVIPTKGAVIPAAVGVDIGCGMAAQRLGGITAADLPDSLKAIRDEIEARIPVGFSMHDSDRASRFRFDSNKKFFDWLHDTHPKLGKKRKLALHQVAARQQGTLGGGNHFIELCLDQDDGVWVMLHSGSRGIGNELGSYFINLAKDDMRTHFINLPDSNLAYLSEGTQHYDDYLRAMNWAQNYARMNRESMMLDVLEILSISLPEFSLPEKAVNCHHNYVELENHFGANVLVTRKGAVRAREGDLGIIPGSMGAKSFIVRGKGNVNSFHSCSHGAGRVMSRSQAKQVITLEEHVAATEGVECRKDAGVIDESPAAYKDIDAVMAAQTSLVDVLYTLKQVLCVKG